MNAPQLLFVPIMMTLEWNYFVGHPTCHDVLSSFRCVALHSFVAQLLYHQNFLCQSQRRNIQKFKVEKRLKIYHTCYTASESSRYQDAKIITVFAPC